MHLQRTMVRTILFLNLVLSTSGFISSLTTDTNASGCSMSGDVFNCSGKQMTSFPLEIDLPKGPNPILLDLSNNNIVNISGISYSPKYIERLRTLNLARNNLFQIQNYSFSKFTHLRTLDLSSNAFRSNKMHEYMFYDLEKLCCLSMSNNPLGYIKANLFTFTELPAIEVLNVSRCGIQRIEQRAIDLPRLEILDLSWNQLTHLDSEAFKMMVNLETLDISHNKIHAVTDLPYFPELKTFILDFNNIETITIREKARIIADKLQLISLKNNYLKTLTADSIPWGTKNLKLFLDNNPVTCDCHLKWAQLDKDITAGNFSIICRYPERLRGQELLMVHDTDLTCTSIPLLEILFVVGLVLIVVLVAGITTFLILRRRRKYRANKDGGGDYVAVYTRDEEENVGTVTISDNKSLINKNDTFDV